VAHAQLGNRALFFTGEGGGGSPAGFAALSNQLVAAGAGGVDTNSSTLSGADLTNYRMVFLIVNTGLSAGSRTTLQTFYGKGGTIVGVADGKGFKDASSSLNALTSGLGLGNMFTSSELDANCSRTGTASGAHPLNTGAATIRYAYGSDVNGGTLVFAGETMDLVRVDGHFIAIGDMNAISEDCSASPAGNLAFYANMWTFAKSIAVCGNGAKEGTEQCDDGNQANTDGCLASCLSATCGDGYVNAGVEQCDDQNSNNTDGCVTGCKLAACGDGFVQNGAEQCDDANQVNTDDCLSTCKMSSCGDGFVHDGMEECDDGNLMSNDDCLPSCQVAKCGDGAVHTGSEMCDDGNEIDADACKNNCSPPSCGDGVVSLGIEDCDGGGSATSDCNENCTIAKCGDGIVNEAAGEDCDGGSDCTTDCLSTSSSGDGDGAGGCCDAGGTTPGQVGLWALVALVTLRRRRAQ
jgi:cysteine-rich repeat protein